MTLKNKTPLVKGYNALTMNYNRELMGFSHVYNSELLIYELLISGNGLNYKI